MQNNVTIKGKENGLEIMLGEKATYPVLREELLQKLKKSQDFFKDSQTKVVIRGKKLSEAQRNEIKRVFAMDFDIHDVLYGDEADMARPVELSIEKEARPQKEDSIPEGTEDIDSVSGKYIDAQSVFINGTVRSGQRIESEGDIVIVGDVNPGAEVIARFERFHLSYLNFEYNQKEHAKWKAASYTGAREPYQKDKSVYEFIEDHMGYRFVLTKLDMPEAVTAGDTLTVNAEITNAGFAPLLKNPVSAELRIADADGNVIAMDSQSVDLNGKNIAFSVSIPENATQGQYTLFAAFDSGIRLANKDAWSIQQNANRLSVLNIQSA